MKITSTQLSWTLATTTLLGFFTPWVHQAPKNTFDNSLQIATQLATGDKKTELLYDYILISNRDWQALWQNPAKGESGYQIMLTNKNEPDTAAPALAKILLGDKPWQHKNKLLALAPLLALASAITLTRKNPSRRPLIVLTLAETTLYLLTRWQLHTTYIDRLTLELNWGIWLTLYSLALMATLQTIRILLPPKIKW
jgi:hypothetical protein